MADRPTPAHGSPGADPLEVLDADLNIFALANGMDLERRRDGVPCRRLEWFRDGLERTIRIDPVGEGAASLSVAARPGRRGQPGEARRELHPSLAVGEMARRLRPLLAEALEAANGIAEDELA